MAYTLGACVNKGVNVTVYCTYCGRESDRGCVKSCKECTQLKETLWANTELVELHNAERTSRRVPSLTLAEDLVAYAQSHATRMAKRGRLYHSNIRRIGGWAAENIARGQSTPEAVMRSWMNSRGHRANILNPRYKEIGWGRSGNYWCVVFRG